MKRAFPLMIMFVTLLVTGACSSDSGGGGLSVASLEGTWFGAGRDLFNSVYGTITVTLDGEGGLTGSETVTPSSFSGTYALESGQVFGFDLTDGTEGGFIANSAGTHAVFANEFGSFGVIEKDTTSFTSSYSQSEMVGSWSGIGVVTDFIDFTVVTSSATVSSDRSFSVSDSTGDTITGTIPYSYFATDIGVYDFVSSSSTEGSGYGEAFLSPDKSFAGTWGCTGGCSFPDDLGFTAWDRQ